jgi:hypothetical protein
MGLGMSIELKSGATSDILTVDPGFNSARATLYPPEAIAHYRLCATSGVITGVAAGTATAGFLFALRAPATNVMVMQRLKVKLWTIVQPTATLEVSLKAFRLTGYTVAVTGGTTIALTSPQFKKRTAYASTTIQAASIATTGALTAGTHTLDTNEFVSEGTSEAAAAEATSPNLIELEYLGNEAGEHGMIFTGNEGFIIRNEVLMSAAFTCRMSVAVDWFEVATYA